MAFVDTILEQAFKIHPALFAFVIITTGSVLAHSYSVFAQEDVVNGKISKHLGEVHKKFAEIDKEIKKLADSVSDQFTQQTIRQLNSEIYDIENVIERGGENPRDHRRLKNLKNELSIALRKLHGHLIED